MRLETVSKIKGWVALVCLAIFFAYIFTQDPKSHNVAFFDLLYLVVPVGLLTGISWFRGRRRIREAEFIGRTLAKGR